MIPSQYTSSVYSFPSMEFTYFCATSTSINYFVYIRLWRFDVVEAGVITGIVYEFNAREYVSFITFFSLYDYTISRLERMVEAGGDIPLIGLLKHIASRNELSLMQTLAQKCDFLKPHKHSVCITLSLIFVP